MKEIDKKEIVLNFPHEKDLNIIDTPIYKDIPNIEKGAVVFYTKDGEETLKISPNGDFYVKGKKVANDIEVYESFKEWLIKASIF